MSKAEELAEQHKGRADDCGELARAILADREKQAARVPDVEDCMRNDEVRRHINELTRFRYLNQWLADAYSNKLHALYEKDFCERGHSEKDAKFHAKNKVADVWCERKTEFGEWWKEGQQKPYNPTFAVAHDTVSQRLISILSPTTEPSKPEQAEGLGESWAERNLRDMQASADNLRAAGQPELAESLERGIANIKNGSHAVRATTPPASAVGDQVDLHDFTTHRAAWRKAIENLALQDDSGYWPHELKAFDNAMIEFDRAALASKPASAAGERESLTDEERLGWAVWRIKDLEDKLRAALASKPLPEQVAQDSQAALDVLAERERQKSVEGWTPEHDDSHRHGDMSTAAACYAMMGRYHYPAAGHPPPQWPWDAEWWKPTTYRRNLVKAGALIIAEIERLDRAARTRGEGSGT